ncbi:hypothetical protein K438DRAFT_801611 [Mycena galopus ATCC 62051]|nr:hypothetical protein K438DRAFT_801611 [Mycena galopus ATCC 62051]
MTPSNAETSLGSVHSRCWVSANLRHGGNNGGVPCMPKQPSPGRLFVWVLTRIPIHFRCFPNTVTFVCCFSISLPQPVLISLRPHASYSTFGFRFVFRNRTTEGLRRRRCVARATVKWGNWDT